MKTESSQKTRSDKTGSLPRFVRLSDPQRRLLVELNGGATAEPEYKPARKLVGLGFAFIKEGTFSNRVRITEKGRSYLSQNVQGEARPQEQPTK